VDDKIWKKCYDFSDSLSFIAISDDKGRITIPAFVKIKSKSIVSVIVKSLKGEIEK